MKNKIKELYEQLPKKMAFISALAEEMGMSRKYMTNYWFPYCDIPENHQDFVYNFLKNTLKDQLEQKVVTTYEKINQTPN